MKRTFTLYNWFVKIFSFRDRMIKVVSQIPAQHLQELIVTPATLRLHDHRVVFHLWTVASAAVVQPERLLEEADGIVFVVDSQRVRMARAVAEAKRLKLLLAVKGVTTLIGCTSLGFIRRAMCWRLVVLPLSISPQ